MPVWIPWDRHRRGARADPALLPVEVFRPPRERHHRDGPVIPPPRHHIPRDHHRRPHAVVLKRPAPLRIEARQMVPASPFVGPSFIANSQGGSIHIHVPIVDGDGQPLGTPARQNVGPVPMAAPAPQPMPVQWVQPSPAQNCVPWTPALVPGWVPGWVPHPWPAPQVAPQAFWPANAFAGPREWRPPQCNPMIITGGNPLPARAQPDWQPVWPPVGIKMYIPVQLHPHLAPNPYDTIPQIDWDMSTPPITARRLTGRNCILPATNSFKEYATWPPAPSLLMVFDSVMMQRWGPLRVDNSKCVTFGDVLNAIHQYWQRQLTWDEMDELGRFNPQLIDTIYRAYEKRCARSPGLADVERSQGVRRVDILGGRTMWWGLWITHEHGCWTVNVGTRYPDSHLSRHHRR